MPLVHPPPFSTPPPDHACRATANSKATNTPHHPPTKNDAMNTPPPLPPPGKPIPDRAHGLSQSFLPLPSQIEQPVTPHQPPAHRPTPIHSRSQHRIFPLLLFSLIPHRLSPSNHPSTPHPQSALSAHRQASQLHIYLYIFSPTPCPPFPPLPPFPPRGVCVSVWGDNVVV